MSSLPENQSPKSNPLNGLVPPAAQQVKVPEDLKVLGAKFKKGFLKAFSEGVSALDKATTGTQARAKGEQLLRAAKRPGAWKDLLSPPNAKEPLPIKEIKDRVATALVNERVDSRLRSRVAAFIAAKTGGAGAPAAVDVLHGAIEEYVRRVPVLIELASAGAAATGNDGKLNPVLHVACRVFLAKDDLIPESEGLYGLIDNAYLAIGVLQAASEVHAKRAGKPLFDVDLSGANAAVRELVGPEQAAHLDARLAEIKDHEAFKLAVKCVVIAAGVAAAAILLGNALQAHPDAGRMIVRGAARKLGGVGAGDVGATGAASALPDATGGPGSWGPCTEDEIARLTAQIGLCT